MCYEVFNVVEGGMKIQNSKNENNKSDNPTERLAAKIEWSIKKHHDYYAKRDKKFKIWVYILRIMVSGLSVLGTIVLGLKGVMCIYLQLNIGLVISGLTSLVSGILAYFNVEKYWMRNITNHIELNMLRDEFSFDKEADRLDDAKLAYYQEKLKEIEQKNIKYWKEVYRNISD